MLTTGETSALHTHGLSILQGPVTMYRVSVAQPGRGPLNPMERPSDPAIDRRDWNRFDTPGLTIYGADQRVTAFTESIAYKAPAAKNYAALSEEARFLGIRLTELLTDLRSAGIPIDGMEPDWRLNREIYRLEFPGRPWVELPHPDTIIAIKTSDIAATDRMSVADLTGDDRALTTAVAQWIRAPATRRRRTPSRFEVSIQVRVLIRRLLLGGFSREAGHRCRVHWCRILRERSGPHRSCATYRRPRQLSDHMCTRPCR